ncbi:MAG: hypothetical protein K1Y36_11660 [Blastocatellia bacterium]|nr:hypothetical protein [Blastocatellia bacterium]
MPTADPAPQWSFPTRVLFCFTFAYLVLYNLPFPLNIIPAGEGLARPYAKLWDWLVPWVGQHLFSLVITVRPNGSGDTTYNYVQVCCFVVLAVAATLIWLVADRKRPHYRYLAEWLNRYLAYSLMTAMFLYGSVKVFQSQFPPPTLDRLTQPFGDASPMGLLWTFMGASRSYNFFAGMCEMVGGFLVGFRRTRTLGALVCAGVMSNVVMLNFSYDVPVKLYSSHLLAMALFLTLPDLRRLLKFFVLNQPTEAVVCHPPFTRSWLNRAATGLSAFFVFGLAAYSLYDAAQPDPGFDLTAKSPYYGIWLVDEFAVNGQPLPLTATDDRRWRKVIFDTTYSLGIQNMSDSRSRYFIELDPEKKILSLSKREDPAWEGELKVEQPAPENLILEGMFGGQPIRATLHRVEVPRFHLVHHGFHWINERPPNR